MKTGIELIEKERIRQVLEEGWTPEHDEQHKFGELSMAASCYAMPPVGRDCESGVPVHWPFEDKWWKPGDYSPLNITADKESIEARIRELTKAGALIAAEIDRLQRLNQ